MSMLVIAGVLTLIAASVFTQRNSLSFRICLTRARTVPSETPSLRAMVAKGRRPSSCSITMMSRLSPSIAAAGSGLAIPFAPAGGATLGKSAAREMPPTRLVAHIAPPLFVRLLVKGSLPLARFS